MSDNLKLNGKSVLISGANRGIGKAILIEMLNRGASKVYAGSRKIEALSSLKEQFGDKLIPVQLDVTDMNSIKHAAEQLDSLDILINNAGVFAPGTVFSEDAEVGMKQNFDVNVWGVFRVTRAFKEKLNSEESAIVNVISMVGLANMPMGATYSMSKAATHSLTQALRAEMQETNTTVIGVYPGPIDTDMTAAMEFEKDSTENVAKAVADGIENGTEDVFPDTMSLQVGQYFMTDPKGVEKQFATFK